jgi:DsbC/DsbD-like thiol-disulfide interchange protein
MVALPPLLKILPALLVLASPAGSRAQDASPWAEGHRSRVRLLAGGLAGDGALAGIEIALDAGFKTYWRNPGESGLPPSFDWSKSVNVRSVEVLWPAPGRSQDAGGVSYGYSNGVVFPVRVRAAEPDKLVTLALRIDYGVCKDICIPAQADLTLTLWKDVSPAARALIDAALARVPRPQPLGGGGKLAILGVELAADGKGFDVKVRAPKNAQPELFVEGPDTWLLAPAESKEPATPGSATGTFRVDILDRPKQASGPVDLRLTLVAGDLAIETTTRLDATALHR